MLLLEVNGVSMKPNGWQSICHVGVQDGIPEEMPHALLAVTCFLACLVPLPLPPSLVSVSSTQFFLQYSTVQYNPCVANAIIFNSISGIVLNLPDDRK